MNAPLDALAQHAQQLRRPHRGRSSTRRAAPAASTTTFAELNALVNRLAHGLLAGGRAAGRAARVVRAELARGARHDPRGPQAQSRRGPAVVPVQRRGDGVRHRQLRRDDGRHRRRRGAARRRGPRAAPEGPQRSSCSAAPRRTASCAGTTCARANPRPSPTIEPGSEAGSAMIYTSGTTGKPKGALRTRTDRQIVFALLAELQPAARERGAPHDRSAVPLRPARVRVARRTRSARRSSCCASSTRRAGSIW